MDGGEVMTWLPIVGPPLVLLVVLVGLLWLMHREQWRWQWRDELRRQLPELEDQIREEALPEEERAQRLACRAEQAEIKREARRRLGLPEDAEP
jgi:hypothetical protein